MMLSDNVEGDLPMTSVPSITRTIHNAALMLMLAVSGVALLGCAGDRAYQDPSTNTRVDFPFLGFDSTDAREAALLG